MSCVSSQKLSGMAGSRIVLDPVLKFKKRRGKLSFVKDQKQQPVGQKNALISKYFRLLRVDKWDIDVNREFSSRSCVNAVMERIPAGIVPLSAISPAEIMLRKAIWHVSTVFLSKSIMCVIDRTYTDF